jgi:purine-cytosine permease-like protein
MGNNLDKLKDIRDIETIHIDFIPYILTAIGIILVICIVLYFIFRKKKKLSKEQLAKKHLKALDIEKLDDKTLAYEFTLYGHICLQKHYEDEFLKIVHQLERYKYKKKVPKIDDDLKHQIKDYIKVRL